MGDGIVPGWKLDACQDELFEREAERDHLKEELRISKLATEVTRLMYDRVHAERDRAEEALVSLTEENAALKGELIRRTGAAYITYTAPAREERSRDGRQNDS